MMCGPLGPFFGPSWGRWRADGARGGLLAHAQRALGALPIWRGGGRGRRARKEGAEGGAEGGRGGAIIEGQ